mgnify:CR=1 FL=1
MRCWGDDNAPQGEYPEGVAPSGRFFGDFLIGEKVTRGADHGKAMISRSARSGECRGAPAPRKEAGSPHPSVEEKKLFLKKIRRPRDFGKLAAALLPVGEKPLHLPPEGGAVVVM